MYVGIKEENVMETYLDVPCDVEEEVRIEPAGVASDVHVLRLEGRHHVPHDLACLDRLLPDHHVTAAARAGTDDPSAP